MKIKLKKLCFNWIFCIKMHLIYAFQKKRKNICERRKKRKLMVKICVKTGFELQYYHNLKWIRFLFSQKLFFCMFVTLNDIGISKRFTPVHKNKNVWHSAYFSYWTVFGACLTYSFPTMYGTDSFNSMPFGFVVVSFFFHFMRLNENA